MSVTCGALDWNMFSVSIIAWIDKRRRFPAWERRVWSLRPPISTWDSPRLTSPSHLCPPNPGGCLLHLHYCADSDSARHEIHSLQVPHRRRNRTGTTKTSVLSRASQWHEQARGPSRLYRQGNATITNQRVPEGREERRRQSTSICQPLSTR